MKILIDTLTFADLEKLNGSYLIFDYEDMKVIKIWQENAKIVIVIVGVWEIEIPRIGFSERFNWFKKQYAGFYITDLTTIINKI
jgi:hypothetical protein